MVGNQNLLRVGHGKVGGTFSKIATNLGSFVTQKCAVISATVWGFYPCYIFEESWSNLRDTSTSKVEPNVEMQVKAGITLSNSPSARLEGINLVTHVCIT